MYKLLLMGITFAFGIGVGKFLKKKQKNDEKIQNE